MPTQNPASISSPPRQLASLIFLNAFPSPFRFPKQRDMACDKNWNIEKPPQTNASSLPVREKKSRSPQGKKVIYFFLAATVFPRRPVVLVC